MIRAGIGQTFEAFGVGLFRLHWLLTVMAFMAFSNELHGAADRCV